jgi:hypothetical protein
MATLKGLDDDHGGAAAGTGSVVGGCLLLRAVTADEDRHGNERGYRSREQLPSPCQVLDPCGIGQQAVMADAVKSRYALQRIKGFMRSPGLCGECR